MEAAESATSREVRAAVRSKGPSGRRSSPGCRTRTRSRHRSDPGRGRRGRRWPTDRKTARACRRNRSTNRRCCPRTRGGRGRRSRLSGFMFHLRQPVVPFRVGGRDMPTWKDGSFRHVHQDPDACFFSCHSDCHSLGNCVFPDLEPRHGRDACEPGSRNGPRRCHLGGCDSWHRTRLHPSRCEAPRGRWRNRQSVAACENSRSMLSARALYPVRASVVRFPEVAARQD